MMVVGKLYLLSLGYIFGSWEMVLGPFGYFLTLFAVWAAINAFNMVDGIDGLLGGLSCVIFRGNGDHPLFRWAIEPGDVVLCNDCRHPALYPFKPGIFGRRYKVFMGDAGSTLIGFTVIWILLETTQGQTHPITPCHRIMDYCHSIDGYDCHHVSPATQRYEPILPRPSAYSPFDHARRFYFPSGICPDHRSGGLLASIGVAAEYMHFIPEWVMLVLFLLAFILYGYCIKRAWRVARFIRRHKRRQRSNTSRFLNSESSRGSDETKRARK